MTQKKITHADRYYYLRSESEFNEWEKKQQILSKKELNKKVKQFNAFSCDNDFLSKRDKRLKSELAPDQLNRLDNIYSIIKLDFLDFYDLYKLGYYLYQHNENLTYELDNTDHINYNKLNGDFTQFYDLKDIPKIFLRDLGQDDTHYRYLNFVKNAKNIFVF
jgi:hypothetical protein